jgi:hypothetical protein
MYADPEKVATDVLMLVAGYEETVVALTARGPARLDRWMCRYWSLRRERLAHEQDVIVGLWLRYASDADVDRKTAELVETADAYRVMKEESERLGIEGGPHLKLYTLYFFPAELRMRKAYGNRVVFKLEPCREEIKAVAVRVHQPAWVVCPSGEPDNCERRRALTERIRARGVQIEDAVRGAYVPIDVADLADFIKRVL